MDTQPLAKSYPKLAELGADLMQVSRATKMLMLGRPILLMWGYVFCALQGWWIAALALFLVGYLALVTAIHDLCHKALKLSPKANQWWLSILGIMAEVSGTAIQATHIVHHRNFSAAFAGNLPEGSHVYDNDPETAFGGLSMLRAVAASPLYQFSLWKWTRLQRAALRRRVQREAAGHFVLGVASVLLLPWTFVPFVYMAAVFVCSIVFPLVSIRLFHDVNAEDVLGSTRSLRGPFPYLTMGMSDHLEHHLYPQVSALKARTLAKRLHEQLTQRDTAATEVAAVSPASQRL